VASPNSLTECTKVLPPATPSFYDKDSKMMSKWLGTTDTSGKYSQAGKTVSNGDDIPNW